MNPQIAGMAATTAAVTFTTFLPSPDVIMASEPTTSLRVNEVSAVAVSVGIGLVLSFAAGDPGALIFAIVVSAITVGGVEYLARTTYAQLEAERTAGYAPDRRI